MIRRANSMSIRQCAALCTVISVCAVVTACDDDPTKPGEAQELVVLDKGLNAYLVVSSDKAGVGSTISVEARIRAVGEDLNPTAFLANLSYDAERLTPVDVILQQDNVVRAVNLQAGPGLIKAAGAAPDGLGTEILVAVTMRVKQADYTASLSIELEELTVVQKNFTDMAYQVRSLDRTIIIRSTPGHVSLNSSSISP